MRFTTILLSTLVLILPALCIAEYFLARLSSPYPGLIIPCLFSFLLLLFGWIMLPFTLTSFLVYFWKRGMLFGKKSALSEIEKSKLDDL